jgi:LEA14-like dessication related protein
MNLIIPTIIGGYVLYKALSTKKTADALDTHITGIDHLVITLWETKFDLKLRVDNPTSQSLNIQEIHLNLLWKNNNLGNINLYQTGVTLPAKQRTYLSLPVSLSNTGIVASLIEALNSGSNVQLQVKGYIKAGGFTSDVNDTISLWGDTEG